MSERAQLKLLVFATENNPLAARISIALANVGFLVAALTPRGHPVRAARKIPRHFAYRTRSGLKSASRAIELWNPDLLVCTDDPAVRELQILHQRAAASHDRAGVYIAGLIERSLGPPTSFSAIANKSELLALAEREGLRCPKTSVSPATRAFQSVNAKLDYPLVVKADQSDGGRGVRIVGGEAELRAAVWELQTPCTWRGRRIFGAILGSEALSPFKLPLRRTISLQEHIAGRPSNRAVICWKGNVLAGISVEVIEVTHEKGPASVVRLIDHPEMAAVCERMVKRLQLSGFVGFDFMLDSADRAWLLEMNPRVTQTCHFFLADAPNLPGALYKEITRQLPRPASAPLRADLIALFPNEIIRSQFGNYLHSCHHDVPWEEPELVRRVLNRALRTGIRIRARQFLEYYFPPIIGALLRLGLIGARSYARPRLKEIAPPS
jgi:glutathione synthase/RimK-type ligase-like ATP-grasp enzyme